MQIVIVPTGEFEPEMETVEVLDALMLEVSVEVPFDVAERRRLVEIVGVAERVFVERAVAVPQGVCVLVLDLLDEDVGLPDAVDVFVEEGEEVSIEPVALEEMEAELVSVGDGAGAREGVCVSVSVRLGRREVEMQEVDEADREIREVGEGEEVVDSLPEIRTVPECVRDRILVPVRTRQAVGDTEDVDVLDVEDDRVVVGVHCWEEERDGDTVPVLVELIVRVDVEVGVGVRERGPLRVPVEDTVDVLD